MWVGVGAGVFNMGWVASGGWVCTCSAEPPHVPFPSCFFAGVSRHSRARVDLTSVPPETHARTNTHASLPLPAQALHAPGRSRGASMEEEDLEGEYGRAAGESGQEEGREGACRVQVHTVS